MEQVVPADGAEEGMRHDVLGVPDAGAEPLRLVLLQEPLQEIAGTGGHVRPQSQRLVEDVVVHLCHVPAVEGRESVEHLVGDHAQAPPVHRPAVVLLAQYLRRQVLWGAAECGRGVAEFYIFFAKAKVCEYNVPRGIQEDVLWLQVSVDDVLFVKVV